SASFNWRPTPTRFFNWGGDFKPPAATGEEHLRMAARLDPHHFWTHYWLGRTLEETQPQLAELAFNTCITLRPDSRVGFDARGTVLFRQAFLAQEPRQNNQLRARARD